MKWTTKASMILAFAVVVLVNLSTIMPSKAESAQDAMKSPLGKLASIKSISVSGNGDAAELLIKLTSPATYTSYKTTAPLRLVLDISQASQGVINAPLVLNKGNFKTVTATRFDTDAGVLTRVDVELLKDVEAVISASASNPGELRISFPSLAVDSDVSLSSKTALGDSITTDFAEKTVSNAVNITHNSIQQTAITRKLTSVAVINDKIILTVDGGVGEFKTFRLNKPERYVIDLIDTQIGLSSKIIPLNSAGVASARIGLYPDKIRVVLDSVNGTFPEASAVKTDKGLAVVLVVKPNDNFNTKLISASTVVEPADSSVQVSMLTKEDSRPIKPVKEKVIEASSSVVAVKTEISKTAAVSTSTSAASVEKIDFQVIDGISRVAVKVKGEFTQDKPVKTPGFVTLTVKNAGLSKSLQHSLETQSFVSPVLRITPLLVKTKSGHDTKIRIAMRVAVPFDFRQEGDMVYVDFKNPEGLTAAKIQAEVQDLKPTKTKHKIITNDEANVASELTGQQDLKIGTDSGKVYSGRKVTLEFADADVRKIFQLLSEVSGKNFVLGDEVTGTISLKLVNVPWTQALDIIVETKGMEYREENGIVMIRGAGKLKSQLDAAAEKRQAQIKSGRMITKNFAINYSNSDDVASAIKPILRYEWQGSLTSDKRTNTVIVNAVEQLMDEIEKLIKVIDIPESQVLIEARIVEASSTFTSSIGVNWGIHYRDGSASFLGINQLDTNFGGIASTPATTTGVSGNSGGAMGISFGTLTSNISLDLRLNAAASAGMIKIVSNPKVATLNNKTAKITQGQQVPYTSSTSDKVETKFVEAALSLEVTPHINSNGTISLKIDAKNDSVGQATGGSTAPAINKKQATTEMLLRDGETTVIGGIYVDSDNDSDDGVPYLMDIPFLGKLFKSTSKTKVKTELLIFITPRILRSI